MLNRLVKKTNKKRRIKMMGVLRNNLAACILVCVVISLGFVNEASADVFSDANLVGFWQFSGDANDSSYSGNDGTLNGDADASYDILALDGTGDYVEVSDDSTLDITGDITISAWIRIEKDNAYQGIVTKSFSSGSRDTPYDFRTNNYWSPLLTLVRASASGYDVLNSTLRLPIDEWHHIAVRVDNTDFDFFVDGLVTGKTGTITVTPTANSRPLYIGRRDDGLYLDGKIDDVMIYDAALSSWEIRQLYDEGNKAYIYSDEVIGDIFRGSNCTASGTKAVALGDSTTASGDYSTALGKDTTASGQYSMAMGIDTIADGNYATAMGYNTVADGNYATAVGYNAEASGDYSFAAGNDANALGRFSKAIGGGSTASGISSTAIGTAVMASAGNATAFGAFSTNDTSYSFTVGYGNILDDRIDFKVRMKQVNVYGDLDVTDTVTMGTLVLPVKTTTGDPASPVEGQIYVNTSDNKVRVYADGAWRDLATW
jgi:hypothetical protein